MYCTLYGTESVQYVPLQYTQYNQIRVFHENFICTKSRSARSSAIIAIWPHLSGILTTKEHVWVGIIEYFLLHSPSIEQNDKVQKVKHLLAYVKWYQNHPDKFNLGNGIVLSATVSEIPTCSAFMPVSRILSRCAIQSTELEFNYGEDSICVAIPLKRH